LTELAVPSQLQSNHRVSACLTMCHRVSAPVRCSTPARGGYDVPQQESLRFKTGDSACHHVGSLSASPDPEQRNLTGPRGRLVLEAVDRIRTHPTAQRGQHAVGHLIGVVASSSSALSSSSTMTAPSKAVTMVWPVGESQADRLHGFGGPVACAEERSSSCPLRADL